ncbi:glycoside hydrolase family 5 protein [Sphingobacterium sp. SGG-5]|uniref:cellulase family glycosylhydrolase n=1 Tax=Sphingobacterium sp. SGG-5 TaxID=2710881 RepID=UPI0013EC3FDA|nr:cellulase family glycosylhydrolase [Sphingobacterium sp. SGG-5]NGM61105.1 glycoside hydrolase family 5 protein [Sphingobacterium sp. SGG-5]
MKIFINAILASFLLLTVSCSGKEPIDGPAPPGKDKDTPGFLTGMEMNKKLGHGINLGGAYEGQAGWPYDTSPEVLQGYISKIAELGFEHIRFPINWERPDRSSETAPYKIKPEFLAEIKTTVDFALSKGLRVIINMHNHDALMENPDGMRPMFREQWRQIANAFKDYSDSLLFEILNEPHSNLSIDKWNDFYADALTIIRQNTTSSSNNKHRCVLIGVANYGSADVLRFLEFPVNDPYTILTVHLYNPFWFTHQDNEQYVGTPWLDTESEREVIRRITDYIDDYAAYRQIPVHIGEFGATEYADPQDRIKYTGFLTKLFTQRGYSWSFFNFHYSWGIYNLTTKQYNQPLIAAISDYKKPLPAAYVPDHSTVLYQSDISASDADGWSLKVNPGSGSAATMSTSTGKISVKITGPGPYRGISLSKSGLSVQQGRRYALSFKTATTVPIQKVLGIFEEGGSIVGEESSLYLRGATDTYYHVFTAQSTQPNGKMTFYLGGNPNGSTVTIEDIQFTEFYDD